MAAGSKKAAQSGGAGPLELGWSGHLEARDAAGERRCVVARDEDGWLLVVHGSALNDEGTSYQWSRQDLDEDGHPVRHAELEDALALAGELAARFDAEHLEAEEVRRVEEPLARAAAEKQRLADEAAASERAAELADATGEEPVV